MAFHACPKCGSLEGCVTADDYYCGGKRACIGGENVTLGPECVSGMRGGAGARGLCCFVG